MYSIDYHYKNKLENIYLKDYKILIINDNNINNY